MQNNVTPFSPPPAVPPRGACEVLAISLGAEEYAIDILTVREIRSYGGVTPIAGAPPHVKGVINLRGAIVPVVDLRLKFGVGAAEYTPFTLTVIVEVNGRTAGLVVDAVSDVLSLPAEAVLPAPEVAAVFDKSSILGLAALDARMLVMLDVAQLLASPEMGLVERQAA